MATSAARSPAKAVAPRKQEVASMARTNLPAEVVVSHDDIAKRAFEKFAGRGYVHGFDERDWFDAEDELRAEYRERL
jgi:Protein of unknown function (DUF2934)